MNTEPLTKLEAAERVREATDADLDAIERPNFFTRLLETNDEN